MKPASAPSACKVQALLGDAFTVMEFDATTRTAADAASAIGCTIPQIAKSLIFRTVQSDSSVLIVASGVNRVDEKLVERLIGEPIGRADAEFVRAATGFTIGGLYQLQAVPEPGGLTLGVLAAAGWALRGWRRRASA